LKQRAWLSLYLYTTLHRYYILRYWLQLQSLHPCQRSQPERRLSGPPETGLAASTKTKSRHYVIRPTLTLLLQIKMADKLPQCVWTAVFCSP
jgi:hypothetical protein